MGVEGAHVPGNDPHRPCRSPRWSCLPASSAGCPTNSTPFFHRHTTRAPVDLSLSGSPAFAVTPSGCPLQRRPRDSVPAASAPSTPRTIHTTAPTSSRSLCPHHLLFSDEEVT